MRSSTYQRRHPGLMPFACLLLLATGLALLGVAQSLADPSIERPLSTDGARSRARNFYDAVNTVVSTGDVTALKAIVAPDFVDHVTIPGLAPGREGLIQ